MAVYDFTVIFGKPTLLGQREEQSVDSKTARPTGLTRQQTATLMACYLTLSMVGPMTGFTQLCSTSNKIRKLLCQK